MLVTTSRRPFFAGTELLGAIISEPTSCCISISLSIGVLYSRNISEVANRKIEYIYVCVCVCVICYSPAGRSVRPWDVLETSSTVFPYDGPTKAGELTIFEFSTIHFVCPLNFA